METLDSKTREVKVFLIGDHVPEQELKNITARLASSGLENTIMKIYQNGERDNVDISTLKADIVTDLYKNSQMSLENKDKEIEHLKKELNNYSRAKTISQEIEQELMTLYPNMKEIVFSQAYDSQAADQNRSTNRYVLNAKISGHISVKERAQIELWLKTRTKNNNVSVYIR